MPSFIRPTYKIVMEEFSSWRPCLGCFHSSRRSSPTADIKDRNLRKRLQKFCRISTLKSSNAPIGSADLWSCPNAGSSSAPSHGSIAADGSPRIGRTSTERRSRSCASHQSASCSENSAIRPELSGQTLNGYGIGAFVQGNGTYNQPTNANEKSALRMGLDADFLFCNTPFVPLQEFQLMPYFQTDFRGRAKIAGFDSLWGLTDTSIHLGGRTDVPKSKLIGFYYRVVGEANLFDVKNAGLTNYLPNTTHAFLGGRTELRAVLFENNPDVWAPLCGRISLVGTAQYLWDAVSQKPVYLYGGEVGYNLTPGPSSSNCQGSGSDSPPPPGPTGSISFSYNQGTDPMTSVKQNVYKGSLKLSY